MSNAAVRGRIWAVVEEVFPELRDKPSVYAKAMAYPLQAHYWILQVTGKARGVQAERLTELICSLSGPDALLPSRQNPAEQGEWMIAYHQERRGVLV